MKVLSRHLLLVVVSLAASQAFAAKKTLEEHWKDVGLTFEAVGSHLSTKECYGEEKAFLACVHGLNAMLGGLRPPVELVAKERLENNRGVEADFAEAAIVGDRKFDSESVAEVYNHMRRQRAADNAAWKALFKLRDEKKLDIDRVVAWVKDNAVFKEKEAALTAAALNGMAGVLRDPHTVYLPAAYANDQREPESLIGIGILFSRVKKGGKQILVVNQPMDGGPALRAGVRANDIITHVDGKAIEGLPTDEARALLLGEKGSKVVVTLLRKGNPVEVTITREQIVLQNVVHKVVPAGKGKAGYVKLRSFMKRDGCDEVEAAVSAVVKEGVDGIVFDLRGNGGGLLLQSVCIANLFLDSDKTVVTTKSLNPLMADRTHRTTKAAKTNLPLVTLIDARSASASELVAGALQDHKRGFILGARTYGKGSVQTERLIEEKILLRDTVARFYLPSGRTNQIEGVHPDVTVHSKPNPTADDTASLREEDEYAALPSQGEPWKQPRPEAVKQLETCVQKNGKAAESYKAGEEEAILPDYQLLYAQDAISCIVDEGIAKGGGAFDRAPAFAEKGSSFEHRLRESVRAFFM